MRIVRIGVCVVGDDVYGYGGIRVCHRAVIHGRGGPVYVVYGDGYYFRVLKLAVRYNEGHIIRVRLGVCGNPAKCPGILIERGP